MPASPRNDQSLPAESSQVRVSLENVAHGGWCVGRVEGKVVFVSGGLPGEVVDVEITQRTTRFDRGQVVAVVSAVPGRREPPCPIASQCGGCQWQHAEPELQRALKTDVVRDQLSRLAGITWDGEVEAVAPEWHWRTRNRYAVSGATIGFRQRRSHAVVALPAQGCRIAVAGPAPAELARLAGAAGEVEVTSGMTTTVRADAQVVSGPHDPHFIVAGKQFLARGFWQPHVSAPQVLTATVLELLAPEPGEFAVDMYCGAGLFSAALIEAGCRVVGIEASRTAVADARRNVAQAKFLVGSLPRDLARLPADPSIVVLDPPREGAGAAVVRAIADQTPRAVAYVACDPAALARDLATFQDHGYRASVIRSFDLFPHTHHVECVALLQPIGRGA
ncbi:MAG: class I SAM-dependent RNA methyltransferase [Arachnia sp.]